MKNTTEENKTTKEKNKKNNKTKLELNEAKERCQEIGIRKERERESERTFKTFQKIENIPKPVVRFLDVAYFFDINGKI